MKYERRVGASPRHIWKRLTYPLDQCQRCDAVFSYTGSDTHGPVYCVPTPEWLKEHPDDDRKER